MSPVPPNKDGSLNNKDIKPTEPNSTAEGTESNESEQVNDDENGYYVLLNARTTVSENGNGNDNEDEDDDDDDETESEEEIDPDEHFAIFASSRAFEKSEKKAQSKPEYSHLFDTDVFERKIALECEEIDLDENKCTTIKNLMQNFKIPEEAIPTWAKVVPEDAWKKNLLDSLTAKKLDLFDSSKK